MKEQINKKFLFIILIFIFLVLTSAFVVEYGLDHKPCELCLYQRIPYFISALLIINIFLIKKYEKITFLLLSFVFAASAILAFYHFGIEQGFFKESTACTTGNFSETMSKEEVLEQLKQSKISCKDVNLRIFGFSLATINFIFSIALSAVFTKLFINYGKN
tara:strand:- start:2755 stop:3237 length:483 start_codon:yes stop_codon:yes gene_type:complete